MKPFLDNFIFLGNLVSKGHTTLFKAVFEYKYFIALIIFLALYAVTHAGVIGLAILEDAYDEGRRFVKKTEEKMLNKELKNNITYKEKKLNNYQIYVETSIKPKFSHKELNINLKEQNDIMNKFLMSKLDTVPAFYGNGFLYSFSDFNKVDSVLEVFFKLIKSQAPLDYIICVQILGDDSSRETNLFKKLIALKFLNKITMVSDTAYRYKFNSSHRYGVTQLGLFQKDIDTFEAHAFEEI